MKNTILRNFLLRMETKIIEGTKHEWLSNQDCDFWKCKKNKELITWCDECDIAFCKEHTEYHNNYDEGRTYCPICWYWRNKKSKEER